jgi:hypothetical protein
MGRLGSVGVGHGDHRQAEADSLDEQAEGERVADPGSQARANSSRRAWWHRATPTATAIPAACSAQLRP